MGVPSRTARRLWVIKVGSRPLIEWTRAQDVRKLTLWLRAVRALRRYGIDVVWVSSGAIATARGEHAFGRRSPMSLERSQALAAIGQPSLMARYLQAATPLGLSVAQVLLTAEDIRSPTRRHSLVRTLDELLGLECLPVLNENDTLSTAEIEFGDNDQLASHVALALGAERLVLISSSGGLRDASGEQVREVEGIGARELTWVERAPKLATVGSLAVGGRGGMRSKLLAARRATRAGIECWIIGPSDPKQLAKIARGRSLDARSWGTRIGAWPRAQVRAQARVRTRSRSHSKRRR